MASAFGFRLIELHLSDPENGSSCGLIPIGLSSFMSRQRQECWLDVRGRTHESRKSSRNKCSLHRRAYLVLNPRLHANRRKEPGRRRPLAVNIPDMFHQRPPQARIFPGEGITYPKCNLTHTGNPTDLRRFPSLPNPITD